MPLRPNPPATNTAAARAAIEPETEPDAMLADDLHQHDAHVVTYGCDTCHHNATERVTVPHSVIMDAVVEESTTPGPALAKTIARDPRITATTDRDPEPHAPSERWNDQRLLEVATTLRNRRLIPFSPFAPNIVGDGLRDRAEFRSWVDRYFADLPFDSVYAEFGPAGEPMEGIEAPADGTMVELVVDAAVAVVTEVEALVADVPEQPASAVVAWIGDDRARAMAANEVEGRRVKGRRVTVDRAISALLGDDAAS